MTPQTGEAHLVMRRGTVKLGFASDMTKVAEIIGLP
jgi:hypothetical protein